jgi:hypothetical protein
LRTYGRYPDTREEPLHTVRTVTGRSSPRGAGAELVHRPNWRGEVVVFRGVGDQVEEFRENLEWAVIVPGDRETSAGVAQLLGELSARGIAIRRL